MKMDKKLFAFNTKTLVATALGAAIFMVLAMFVKIPTGIPNTEIQTTYGVCSFFATLFGPICGGLVAFRTETVYGLGGDGLNPDSSKKSEHNIFILL